MWYGVGIDLGTSFTAAAVNDPGGTRMVPLSPEVVIPSVACAAPDGSLLTGTAAQNAAAEPARVARGFKRRLGDPTPLVLGGTAYSPAALMAAQLRDVLTHVTSAEGGPPASIVLTCPAIWGPYRREHFAEVPRLAGVRDFHLVTEPEAAATHYSMERRLGDGELVAVYDLGGGTFDTTILRMRSGGMEILGTPEGIEHLGGIDFDETFQAHVDDRLDGAISQLDPADPRAATTLAEIRAMCVRAKEELSTEPDVLLSVPLPSGPREVMVTRLELNDMIRPSVELTTDALRRTIASAGLRPDDLSAVLLAGGSSRIPLVPQMVSKGFGKPVRVTLHPKFTVALGAAAVAGRVLTATPPGGVARQSPPGEVVRQAPPSLPVVPTAALNPAAATSPAPATRRKWLVPAAAAAVVMLAAAVITLVISATGGDARQTGAGAASNTTSARAKQAPPPTLPIYAGAALDPYHSLIASSANWSGTQFDAEGASHPPIAAAPDGAKGLRVTWAGGAPGQIYLQSTSGPRDLKSYVDSDSALVFDTVVHSPPAGRTTTVAVHCVYPCAAQVKATTLFRNLPVESKTTVKIPLSCFTDAGLDPTKVNTTFLVYAEDAFDATFSNIRWEPGAATDPDATACGDLK